MRHMYLLPDDRKMLDSIDSDLCATERRLASIFRIFTRLTADDGQPPDEDLVVSPRRPPGLRGSGVNADGHARDHIVLVLLAAVPALMLILSLLGFR
jgi:hypothetical protein